MTNADLPVFFLFRHVKQGAFNHTEFKKNFQISEPSDTKSKATESPPERKNKLVNSSRAKYKFVHLMKLICKFIVNTQNTIRSCLLALIFDPTTLIEIAVYNLYIYKITTPQNILYTQHCGNNVCHENLEVGRSLETESILMTHQAGAYPGSRSDLEYFYSPWVGC